MARDLQTIARPVTLRVLERRCCGEDPGALVLVTSHFGLAQLQVSSPGPFCLPGDTAEAVGPGHMCHRVSSSHWLRSCLLVAPLAFTWPLHLSFSCHDTDRPSCHKPCRLSSGGVLGWIWGSPVLPWRHHCTEIHSRAQASEKFSALH
jgi:hypothetical protein